MDCSLVSGDIIMDTAFDIELKRIENEWNLLKTQADAEVLALEKIDFDAIQRCPSCLDAWDYCFSLAFGYLAIGITTEEQFAVYLETIHKASSGATGDYDKLQTLLGKLLYHKGDHIDMVDKNFKNRKGKNAYGAFHRLLWGHDILSVNGDNPIVLMIKQKGISGILQAFQHLIADTASKQGLPLPGSSYFDFEKENGAVSNYLIRLSEELSEDSIGNKQLTQSIYSHMFSIRASDCIGSLTIENLSLWYFKVRGCIDDLRQTQFRIISYTIAFLGHLTIGSIRQFGIPYLNISELKAIINNLKNLYVGSWRGTRELCSQTEEYIQKSDRLLGEVNGKIRKNISYEEDEDYMMELENGQKNIKRLIGLFSKGED